MSLTIDNNIISDKFDKYLLNIIDKYYQSYIGIYLNIDELSDDEISILIEDIYESTRIKYIIYDNKTYYGTDSLDNKSGSGSIHDPRRECGLPDGYIDECLTPPVITNINENDIQYVFNKYYNYGVYISGDLLTKAKDMGVSKKFIKKLQNYNYNQVFLTSNTKNYLRLLNPRGVNIDHRGSNHCYLELPFINDQILTLPISLSDITTPLYNIKSHKWGKWYELYCNCHIENNINTNYIMLKFDFDHGS